MQWCIMLQAGIDAIHASLQYAATTLDNFVKLDRYEYCIPIWMCKWDFD